jgi:hypothetical protein
MRPPTSNVAAVPGAGSSGSDVVLILEGRRNAAVAASFRRAGAKTHRRKRLPDAALAYTKKPAHKSIASNAGRAAVGFPEAFAAASCGAFPLLGGRLESYKRERRPIRLLLRRPSETAKPSSSCEIRMANGGGGVAQGLLTITA